MASRFVISAFMTLASVALFAAVVAGYGKTGFVDFAGSPQGACDIRVTSAAPSAVSDGLRPGDVIETDKMDFVARTGQLFGLQAGQSVDWPVLRDGLQRIVRVTYQPVPPAGLASTIIRLAFLALGLVALWRGRDGASLGLGVFFCGISTIVGADYSILGPVEVVIAEVLISVLGGVGLLGLVYLAMSIAAPYVSAAMIKAAWIIAGIGATVYTVQAGFSGLSMAIEGCAAPATFGVAVSGFTLEIGVAMFLLGGTLRRAPATVRGRVRWIYWTTIVGFAGPFADIFLQLLHIPQARVGWIGLTILVIPIGFAYAVLRHRLVDIGFVVNRALVYGAMTTVIVGVLAVAEALLAKAAVGKGAGIAVEVAVALALGVSFNALHSRIDRFVDRIFFRKKHEAEEALNLLAHESAFVEKPDALLDRAIGDVYAQMGPRGCAIYERIDGGYRVLREKGDAAFPAIVDADDPAFVRLRASAREVVLDDVRSALGANGLAVPMTVRGTLFGAIVLAPRVSDEPYAPDEVSLLRTVARELAAALAAMLAREHAELVDALATGLIDVHAAQTRARELRLT